MDALMRRRRLWQATVGYLGIVVGAAVLALALDWFTVPNRIAAGGVSGLATVTHYLFGWPVGGVMLAVNIPLFLAGIKVVGFRFGLRSLVGAAATSVFVDLFAPLTHPLTHDPVLASIYGGILTGVGVGITFHYGGSTGGTDIAARLLHHFARLGIGRSFMVIDAGVILWAGFAFNPELAMYAFVSLFVASKTIDFFQEGRPYAKAAFIVSERAEEIGRAVLEELDRGATSLQGRGVFTGRDRDVLFVIVGRPQIHLLSGRVREIDPRAFMVITDVSEVLGEGFQALRGGA